MTYVSSNGSYKVKGSHTYASNGSHTVTTTVVEAEGSGGAKMALAAVTASPPSTLTTSQPISSNTANNSTTVAAASASRTAALDELLADLLAVSPHRATAPAREALVDQVLGGWDRSTDDTVDWLDAADPLASSLETALESLS